MLNVNSGMLQVLWDSKVIMDWEIGLSILKVLCLEAWKRRIWDLQEVFEQLEFQHAYKDFDSWECSLSKGALDL